MTSASSSAARLLIRDGKPAVSKLFRARTANLTEKVHMTAPAVLLGYNQTPVSQYPVFSETFPVVQSGLGFGFIQQEAVSERRGKMQAVDNECSDTEEETDSDEEEFDDIDMDDDDEFDDSEEEEDKNIAKKKKK